LAWTVEFQGSAAQQLRKLDRAVQQRILAYFRNRVLAAEDPRKLGKSLSGDKGGLWRYCIGDYRAICKLEDEQLVVLVLEIGHGREVYR
jgi:mRNA interferase RelE/StbE